MSTSLRNLAVKDQKGVYTPPVEATAVTLIGSPANVVNGLQLAVADDVSFATRRTMTFKSKPPVYDSKTAEWSKQKVSIVATTPFMDANQKIKYNSARFELDVYPSTDTDARDVLISMLLCAITSAESTQFINTGSLD